MDHDDLMARLRNAEADGGKYAPPGLDYRQAKAVFLTAMGRLEAGGISLVDWHGFVQDASFLAEAKLRSRRGDFLVLRASCFGGFVAGHPDGGMTPTLEADVGPLVNASDLVFLPTSVVLQPYDGPTKSFRPEGFSSWWSRYFEYL